MYESEYEEPLDGITNRINYDKWSEHKNLFFPYSKVGQDRLKAIKIFPTMTTTVESFPGYAEFLERFTVLSGNM